MPPFVRSAVRALAIALAPIFVITLGATPAHATFDTSVTTTVTPQGGGTSFLYSYAVNVLATSTNGLSEFDLNITAGNTSGINTPLGATLTSITMPTGFINDYTLGNPTIAFLSTDPTTDIPAGSLGTFSFISTSVPVLQPYQFRGFDGAGNPVSVSGFVLAPVPEPASLTLFGLGAAAVAGAAVRRNRRRLA